MARRSEDRDLPRAKAIAVGLGSEHRRGATVSPFDRYLAPVLVALFLHAGVAAYLQVVDEPGRGEVAWNDETEVDLEDPLPIPIAEPEPEPEPEPENQSQSQNRSR